MLIQQGKTNWRFLSIIIILAIIVGIFTWQYFITLQKETKISEEEIEKIKVISPNGGEQYKPGDVIPIEWVAFGSKLIMLDIRDENDISYGKLSAFPTPNAGSYKFSGTYNLVPGNYKILAFICPDEIGESCWRDIEGLRIYGYDESDNYFSIVAKDETADWKTYTNSQYGFELKYPKDAEIVKSQFSNTDRINLPFGQETLLVEKYLILGVKEITSADSCSNPISTMITETKSVHINNIDFKEEIGNEGAAGSLYKSESYSTIKNNKCFSLSFILHSGNPGALVVPPPDFDMEKESKVFNQILSTFKFIEPAKIDNWQTYNNEDYGFKINYPSFYYVTTIDTKHISLKNQKYKQNPAGGNDFYISILDNPFKRSLREWFSDNSTEAEFGTEAYTQSGKRYYNSNKANPMDISIDSRPALSFTLLGGYPSDRAVILLQIQNNLNLLEISYNRNSDQGATYNQILSTFRFVK